MTYTFAGMRPLVATSTAALGDINNYTLIYVSNNVARVAAFCEAGLPAEYDPQLAYEYSGSTTSNGNLYVAAGAPGARAADPCADPAENRQA